MVTRVSADRIATTDSPTGDSSSSILNESGKKVFLDSQSMQNKGLLGYFGWLWAIILHSLGVQVQGTLGCCGCLRLALKSYTGQQKTILK